MMTTEVLEGLAPETRAAENPAIETRAVHAGRGGLKALGVHAPPIDLSSTYPLGDLEAAGAGLEALAAGADPGSAGAVYSRLFNPTTDRFERALADLERACGAVAFSSGMAALTAVLLAARLVRGGNHVVAVRPLYGGSDHLLTSGLLGLDVTWAAADEVAAAVTPETLLVLLETPANPTLELVDIEDVARQAGDVPLLVDSTFATPILQRPLTLGAALVLHSATKFLGGHGDVLAGVVAGRDEAWVRALRQVRVATGGVLHPLASYLLHRGLQTLPIRVERAQATASELASRLRRHPAVERVFYPSLESSAAWTKQMSGPGAVLAFEVSGGLEAAATVMASLRLLTPAVSLGSVDTLIQHPAALTHRLVDEQAKRETGISPGLLRLSVGLENACDLWNDLDQALGACLGACVSTSSAEARGLAATPRVAASG